MKVLFIGGTGTISSACIRPAMERGFKVYVFNRGNRNDILPPEVVQIKGDISDEHNSRKALEAYRFDIVVDWVAFTTDHIERDIRLFSGKTGQFIFISSASAYQKPPGSFWITESTPLHNPYWEYSRNKRACEQRLIDEYRQKGFPVTIIRPSHTYGNTMIPSIFDGGFTIMDRMLKGKEIIVPGDGTSRWVVTHNTDFAKGFTGLLANQAAIGEAFHITSQEALTWDQIHKTIGYHLGVTPMIRHIAADFIVKQLPEFEGPLKGDKIHSVYFDNSKVKRLVPDFICTTPFVLGAEQTIRFHNEYPVYKKVDDQLNAKLDAVLSAYDNQ